MKQLSSFMVLNIDGGTRMSYTYDEINEETGDLISQNNKKSFFVLDMGVQEHINEIQDYIRENRF